MGTFLVQLVAIQHKDGSINIVPKADDVLHQDDLMILLGANQDLDRIHDLARAPMRKTG